MTSGLPAVNSHRPSPAARHRTSSTASGRPATWARNPANSPVEKWHAGYGAVPPSIAASVQSSAANVTGVLAGAGAHPVGERRVQRAAGRVARVAEPQLPVRHAEEGAAERGHRGAGDREGRDVVARHAAASSIIARSRASSTTGTPISCAFASLLPASAPAST